MPEGQNTQVRLSLIRSAQILLLYRHGDGSRQFVFKFRRI